MGKRKIAMKIFVDEPRTFQEAGDTVEYARAPRRRGALLTIWLLYDRFHVESFPEDTIRTHNIRISTVPPGTT